MFLVFVMDGVEIGFAQPIIPREAIRSHTPADLREVVFIVSINRADAAHCLGNMGERAIATATFFVGILGDRANTVVLPSDS